MNLPDEIDVVLTYKHDSDDVDLFTEKVRAIKHGNYYRLVHIPAFAPNLAVGDIVKVEFDDGEYHFDKLVEESGNSTLHIVLFKIESKEKIIQTLKGFRCGVNTNMADNYLVVNVAPDIFYQPVEDYLFKEQQQGNIDFKESCLSRLHIPAQN